MIDLFTISLTDVPNITRTCHACGDSITVEEQTSFGGQCGHCAMLSLDGSTTKATDVELAMIKQADEAISVAVQTRLQQPAVPAFGTGITQPPKRLESATQAILTALLARDGKVKLIKETINHLTHTLTLEVEFDAGITKPCNEGKRDD